MFNSAFRITSDCHRWLHNLSVHNIGKATGLDPADFLGWISWQVSDRDSDPERFRYLISLIGKKFGRPATAIKFLLSSFFTLKSWPEEKPKYYAAGAGTAKSLASTVPPPDDSVSVTAVFDVLAYPVPTRSFLQEALHQGLQYQQDGYGCGPKCRVCDPR